MHAAPKHAASSKLDMAHGVIILAPLLLCSQDALEDIPMSNLMIDSLATRHSLLSEKVGVYKAPSPPPQHLHSPFLTSEVLVPRNDQTVEQELIRYIEQAYPRTRQHW